ncbi:uncharacterized protein [Triticum aestivum]|uniref:Uncharacterized protein n=1 Tax=Aegilops tauschii subsp. strangulata TaxID=200361 RepID=A0A453CMG4_AEGTS|nr:uncharacterized protein LOC123054165 isoform X5 [Triticum aestivum]
MAGSPGVRPAPPLQPRRVPLQADEASAVVGRRGGGGRGDPRGQGRARRGHVAGVHEGREVGLPDQRPGTQPPGWGEIQRGASRQVSPGRVHWSMQLKLQRKQISTMVLILYWLMCIQEPWCTSLISQVLRLGQSFNRFLAAHDDAEVSLKQMVEELMTDTVKADRSAVPDTGVDPDWEYQLSSIFIDTKKGQARYGTRSMAAIGVKLDGEVTFYERSLASSLWNENVVQFEMDMAQ